MTSDDPERLALELAVKNQALRNELERRKQAREHAVDGELDALILKKEQLEAERLALKGKLSRYEEGTLNGKINARRFAVGSAAGTLLVTAAYAANTPLMALLAIGAVPIIAALNWYRLARKEAGNGDA